MSRLKIVTNESLSGMEEANWQAWMANCTRSLEIWPVVMAPEELGDSTPRGTVEFELRISDVGYYYLCIGAEDGSFIKAWFMGEDFLGWSDSHYQPLGRSRQNLDLDRATVRALVRMDVLEPQDPRPGGTCQHLTAFHELMKLERLEFEAKRLTLAEIFLEQACRVIEVCDCAM